MRRSTLLTACVSLVVAAVTCGTAAAQTPQPNADRPKDMRVSARVFQGKDFDKFRQDRSAGKAPTGGREISIASLAKLPGFTEASLPKQTVRMGVKMPRVGDSTAAIAMVDPLTQPVTLTECVNLPESRQAFGYIKNRFSWCENWGFAITVYSGTQVEGTFTGEVALIGNGSNGSTAIANFYWRFVSIVTTGDVQAHPEKYWIETRLHAIPARAGVPSACGADRWVGRSTILSNWLPNSTAVWSTTPPTTGSGRDNVTLCLFVPYFKFFHVDFPQYAINVGPAYSATTTGSYQNGNELRCDVATYINYGAGKRPKGCSFAPVIGTITFYSQNNHLEAVQHLQLAKYHPLAVKPAPLEQGALPGWNDDAVLKPLRRNYYDDDGLRARASARVQKECQTYWPGYASQGKQCDEYPFNSTFQAATNPQHPEIFSVQAIAAADNQSAGNWLLLYYYYDRITQNEAPFVVYLD